MLWDKSQASLTVKGTIYAYAGSISGMLNFGTQAVTDNLKLSNIALSGNQIWENAYNGDNSAMWINFKGYAGGLTKYRNTNVGDGRGHTLLSVIGGAAPYILAGAPLIVSSVSMTGVTPYFKLEPISIAQRTALTKAPGMMVYDLELRRFCGVIENNIGELEWWTFAMNTNLG
jgi:hypothetical protein